MAISTGHTAVLTTPVQIDGQSTNPTRLRIFNASNDKTIYLGNEGVTTTTGFGLLKEEQLEIILNPGESLWVIGESAGATMHWLRQTLY